MRTLSSSSRKGETGAAVSGTRLSRIPSSFNVPATGGPVSVNTMETSEVRRCAHLFSSICSQMSIALLSEDQREPGATHMPQTLFVGISVKAVSRLGNVYVI